MESLFSSCRFRPLEASFATHRLRNFATRIMYNLPENEDLSFLRNKEIELVCFAAYQVNLHLEGGISITILGSFRHLVAGSAVPASDIVFPLRGSELMRLLQQRIKKIKTEDDSTLVFDFSNGDHLVIRGNNGPYESYHIRHGEKLIVV